MDKWDGKRLKLKKEVKHIKTSDTVFTFDIETTSLFHFADGWRCFRPKLSPESYAGIDKAAVPYIWMFGYEDQNGDICSVYGRELLEFGKLLQTLANPNHKRVIWIFNAAFEFQFFRDILDEYGWTVTKMLSRSVRKPIMWYIKELNIEFRCAYMLTNLSLAKAAEEYTDDRKRVNDLIYTVPRSPMTELSATELGYCAADVEVLVKIIRAHLIQYEHMRSIPYTQTGKVRKVLSKALPAKEKYDNAKYVPDYHVFMMLVQAYQGGIAHACYLYANKVMTNIQSGDMTSAYPANCCAKKYPMSKWIKVEPENALTMNTDNWAILYHVIFRKIESKLFNHYISHSKCLASKNPKLDNGRLIMAEAVEMIITEVDMRIIENSYDFESIEYIETYVNHKDYLPKELIETILDLYGNKTRYKNVPGKEEIYRNSKARINSVYGCFAQNVIKQTSFFEGGEWGNTPVTEDFVKTKLQEQRMSKNNCFRYSWAPYVTAYTRERLWEIIAALDPTMPGVGLEKGVIYYDTDSCKAPPSDIFYSAMQKSNERIDEDLKKMCAVTGIDFAKTRPTDPKGIERPLGYWDPEDGFYREFITLGAKRYAHRDAKTNRLEITVSGVRAATGRKALHDDIRKFKKNLVFGYAESGKQISVYNDDQPEFDFRDVDGNIYHSRQKHGICLMSTTYNMQISPIFEALWEEEAHGEI